MSETQITRPRVGRSWFTLFTLAWIVLWTAQLTPLQLLLPLQLDTPDSATGWVRGVVSSGIVLGVGGLAGVLAGPIAGALSDRQSGSRPKRRPWALAGVWIAAACLLVTGASTSALGIGAAWVGVCIGTAVASAAFAAMIADQLPPEQRGAASSAASSAQALGIVLGVSAVVLLGLSVAAGYVMLAIGVAVLGTLTAILLPDPSGGTAGHSTAQEPSALGEAARGARGARGAAWRRGRGFEFMRDRDFRWVLIGRLVVNVGNALGTSLFLFFLLYGLGQEHAAAEDNLLIVVVVYTVFVVAASVAAGLASDKLGRRRGLALAATVVQALSGVLLVVSPTFGMTIFAAGIMGVGYGAFSTVGLAFATDVLPSERDHGRDLGLVNTAAALGQLLGPVIGALLVALVGGFWLVFSVAAVLSVVGGAITVLARERRTPIPHATR
ncbi:Na+/melibiose symporter-like transporter [Leucobacter komagatae]|uniref:Na+/melibiose symporter-like transporter n=1 Tax=Leucobacter komagatae TaxID=55969 RepID=A0A542Y736_9MICO|nr:MFS transporter [Leucobacter komagatae]TQL43908.1 Na+/melibiose symporter-like transporter [Leucobacter komagatae]